MVAFKDALIGGFLSRTSQWKQANETRDDSEILEGIGAGAALGGSIGAVLPFILGRFKNRVPSRLLDKHLTTHMGALLGGAGGGFLGSRWLPQAVQQGQEGFRAGVNIFPQTQTKQADDTLKGVGLGGIIGAGVSAATALPVLFGRLGRRLPAKVLNKMLLGRALSGAAVGSVVGGIASKPKDNTFHYYYHGTKGGGK